MDNDATLLRRFADDRSESAFAELVQRHVNLVYSAALRRTNGNAHSAGDISQDVFTKLSREAGRLCHHPALSAWLYTATKNAAINRMRADQRRREREEEAQKMHDLISSAGSDTEWETLRPALDATIDKLNEGDRTAVILRFFERRSFAEIGAALDLSENTARMRTDRALEKLRALLARRGITSTSGALALALVGQASIAAPPGFAASMSSAVLAAAARAASGSTFIQAILAMNKLKVGIASGLLIAGATTVIVEMQANRALSSEITALAGTIQRTEITKEELSNGSPATDELVKLRNRIALLKARPDGVTDFDMKPRAQWRNVGRATPSAALETIMWAFSVKDMDTIADSISYGDSDRRILDAWFATLSDAVRAKFGTPERILAPMAMTLSSRGPDMVTAFQTVSQENDHGPEAVKLTYWVHLDSGGESQAKIGLAESNGIWRVNPTGSGLRWEQWKSMVFSQIDPATGNVITPPR